MSNKTLAADTETVSVVAKETKKDESKYPLEALQKNSMKLFGVTSSTFVGAFYGQDKMKKYSVREAKAILDKWLNKEVEN